MENLEKLLQEKELLIRLLKENTEKINNQQILSQEFLSALGFRLIEIIKNELIYEKSLLSGTVYKLYTQLEDPYMVGLQRTPNEKIYSFPIDSKEDFRQILIFLNCI